MNTKRLIRSFLRRAGLEVHRFHPCASTDAALMAAFSAHRVNLVLDVGANEGQFGAHLRELGYRGRIVSFEPLSSAHRKLLATAKDDPSWTVVDRMAIGSSDGELEIHIAGNSVSSSVLPMLDVHSDSVPSSAYVGSERVAVRTLDGVAHGFLRPDSVTFLKIDTQGYEPEVLRGAAQLLQNVKGIQLELSFVPLYEGQLLYDEIMSDLKAMGFQLWGLAPAFIDATTGRLFQVDATFYRF